MTQFSGSHSGVPALREYGICGISYLVINMKEKKVYGGAVTKFQAFSISALDGSAFSARRPQRFIHRENPRGSTEPEDGWGPQAVGMSGEKKNIFHLLGIQGDLSVIQPIAQSLYRQSYTS